MIVETKSKRTDQFRIPGYNVCNFVFVRQGDGGSGDVAIFIRNSWVVEEIEKEGIKKLMELNGQILSLKHRIEY